DVEVPRQLVLGDLAEGILTEPTHGCPPGGAGRSSRAAAPAARCQPPCSPASMRAGGLLRPPPGPVPDWGPSRPGNRPARARACPPSQPAGGHAMPEQPSGAVDRVASLVAGHTEACLAGLEQAGDIPHPAAALRHGGGWVALTMAFPAS